MKTNYKTILPLVFLVCGLSVPLANADRFNEKGDAEAAATVGLPAKNRIKSGVRLTELGRMRVYLALNKEAVAYEDQIHELLSDADFRLFPAKNFATVNRLNPDLLLKEGGSRKADLVFYTKLTLTEETAFKDFKLYSATATSQLYNVQSGELLATTTLTKKGERTTNETKAKSSAGALAIQAAVEGVMEKAVEKQARTIIHEAQFTSIANETEAARILAAAQKLDGVSYARQMWFDVSTGSLGIELIGSPKTVNDWKKWLENLELKEETSKEVEVVPNKGLREKYPDWFKG